MDYLVDAGVIEHVRGVTARDAALMVVTMYGDRATFPIEVHSVVAGESVMFRCQRDDFPLEDEEVRCA